MPRVDVAEIEDLSRAALMRHGAEEWIAASVADALREAEATGNRICGLYYLESYCQQLRTGRVPGNAVPDVTRPRPGSVRVDAKFGFAPPAFQKALPDAIAAAKEYGTASLAVCHAHSCLSLGYFTGRIARAGLIGLGLTNAPAIVAPPGGRIPVIGTNPIAFSVPDGQGGIAMQFDQSTSVTAMGRISMAEEAGKPIPEGWAVDAEGRPTTDPAAALEGSLISTGGYKGWGFGLMAEILTAGLTGSLTSRDIASVRAADGPPNDMGQVYLLIDPDLSGHFAARLARVAEGVALNEGARMPGQGRVEADTVEVPEVLWAQVRALAGAA